MGWGGVRSEDCMTNLLCVYIVCIYSDKREGLDELEGRLNRERERK